MTVLANWIQNPKSKMMKKSKQLPATEPTLCKTPGSPLSEKMGYEEPLKGACGLVMKFNSNLLTTDITISLSCGKQT